MKRIVNFSRPFIFQPLKFPTNSSFKKFPFFLSFSDAVVFLLGHFNINGQSESILLPDFYCPETTALFAKYLKIYFYKTKDNLSIDKNHYFEQIKKIKPRVIVHYGFLGFSLNEQEEKRLSQLITLSTIIIEDCAHKILRSQPTYFLHKNHFYINSIRKHSPFLGSYIISCNNDLKAKTIKLTSTPKCHGPKTMVWGFSFYALKCHCLQLSHSFLDCLGIIFKSAKLFDWSEHIFLKLDNQIGRYLKSCPGSRVSRLGYRFIDLKALSSHRQHIALAYCNIFSRISSNKIKKIDLDALESWELNYFPLFVEPSIQDSLIDYLKGKGIAAERLWEPNKEIVNLAVNRDLFNSFLILPLTWLVKEDDVEYIYCQINNFFSNNERKNSILS